ncbi:MAG: hypothetical protein CVT59_05325 [Actinobacteria bacterium HGW-Actinobacteria-1]|jgi:hypothetical protein|nr:MAG: hypothetical protein CVT59_05325 [Actinobacteria bacterium HGW-Actinobacteria-1]
MTGSANEFLTWFNSWGNVIFVVAQILFWTAIGFAAVYGSLAYKRLVDHNTGVHAAPPVAPMTVKIDEFVE